MLKNIKNVLISFIVVIFIIMLILFFTITNNAYDRKLFFSYETAIKNWGTIAEQNFFEYFDENFFINFDSNFNIKSVKKEGIFWVRNNFDGFPSEDEINMIRSTTVNDFLYIYGITKHSNVKEIQLVDYSSNEKNITFSGKKISESDGLCFCAKVPLKSLWAPSYKIAFVDENDNIISELFKGTNTDLQIHLQPILNNLLHNKYSQVVNKNIALNNSIHTKNKIEEKFYLLRNDNKYFLQEYSRSLDIYFLEEFAMIIDKTQIMQRELNNTSQDFYDTTYQAEYDENLSELKKIIS